MESKIIQWHDTEEINLADMNNVSKFIFETIIKEIIKYSVINSASVISRNDAVTQDTGSNYQTKVQQFWGAMLNGQVLTNASEKTNTHSVPSSDPRIDIIECQLKYTDQNSLTRDVIDKITGVISPQTLYTEWAIDVDIQVVEGIEDPSPVAPSQTSGWMKIGEVFVDTTGGIADADIYNVDSERSIKDNTGWTNEKNITTLLPSLSKLKDDEEFISLRNEEIEGTVVITDPVYWNDSNSRWEKASISNPPQGLYTDSTTKEVTLFGRKVGLSGLTVGTVYMDDSGDLTDIKTNVRIGRAISTTDILIDIDHIDLAELSVGIGQYQHLVENNGKWFNIRSLSSRLYEETDVSGVTGEADFNHLRGIIKNTINDRAVLLSDNGRVNTFEVPESPNKPISFAETTFNIVVSGAATNIILITQGSISYYAVVDNNATPGGAALRFIQLDGAGDMLSVLPNPVNSNGKRNATGVVFYNGYLYVSFTLNNAVQGRTVEKVLLSEAIIEASGGASATWTIVLDLTGLSVQLAFLTIDPSTGVFYVTNTAPTLDTIFSFEDDGNTGNYSTIFTASTATYGIYYCTGYVYFYENITNLRIRKFKALLTYDEIDPAEVEILGARIQPQPLSGTQNTEAFSIYEEDGYQIFYTISPNSGTDNIWIYTHDMRYTIKERYIDDDKYIGIIVDKKAHIINNEWKVLSHRSGIDLVNFYAGRVDGLERIRDSQYLLWAFADADNIFKGFGLTRRPMGFVTGAINYQDNYRGDSFVINVDQWDDTGDTYNNSNILSHFTIGATVQIWNSQDNLYICEITGLDIGTGNMTVKVIYAGHEGISSPGASVTDNWIIQIDNFKPYVNGATQILYQPRYRIVSTIIHTDTFNTVRPIVWNNRECRLASTSELSFGILLPTIASSKTQTLAQWVVQGQEIIFNANDTDFTITAMDLNIETTRIMATSAAEQSDYNTKFFDKWGFCNGVGVSGVYIAGWIDDIDDTRRM